MGAGRGSNRVPPVSDAAPNIIDLIDASNTGQTNGIIAMPTGPFQYRLNLPANVQALTNTFALWEDGSTPAAQTIFNFPLGMVRGSLLFSYVSGQASGQADIRLLWSRGGGNPSGPSDLLVVDTISFAPSGEPDFANVPLSKAIYQTPAATGAAETVQAALDFFVPPGILNAAGNAGSLSIEVRDVQAAPGTINFTQLFMETYGAVQPSFSV